MIIAAVPLNTYAMYFIGKLLPDPSASVRILENHVALKDSIVSCAFFCMDIIFFNTINSFPMRF